MSITYRWVAGALALVGCVAPSKNVGLESETASASEAMSESDSDTSAGGICGDQLDPTACAAAGADAGETGCAWVEITTIQAGGDFCGLSQPRGACIPTFYQGDDCAAPSACGVDGSPTMYFAPSTQAGAVDVIADGSPFCEHQPEGYDVCQFDVDGSLVSGDPACNCLCSGGSGATLPPMPEAELEDAAGCGDMFVYAYNDAATIALSVSIDDDLVADVVSSGVAADHSFEVQPLPAVTLYLGEMLDRAFCTDVGNNGSSIVGTWTATSGTVDVHLEPLDDSEVASATVTLSDATFTSDDGRNEAVAVETFTFTDITVGWLPG